MNKNILFTFVCLYFGCLHAANDARIDLNLFRINVENSPQAYATGKEYANTLICKGILRGVLLNGQLSDYPTAAFENCSNYKEIIKNILFLGDTVTASPRMLSADRCKSGVLNLENMQLVTVRDWQYQEWFNNVLVVNLAYNQLNEVPVPFFKLFPRAEKYILTGNPITDLDTTYMLTGVKVIARGTMLERIISTNLHTHNYTFDIANTPLAQHEKNLRVLIEASKKPKKNILIQFFESCFGKDIEMKEEMMGSVIKC